MVFLILPQWLSVVFSPQWQPHPSLSWPVINQIDQQCHHYLIKHVSPAFNVSSASPAVCSWFFRDFCTKQRKSSFHQTGSPDLPLSLSCSTKHSKTSNTKSLSSLSSFQPNKTGLSPRQSISILLSSCHPTKVDHPLLL